MIIVLYFKGKNQLDVQRILTFLHTFFIFFHNSGKIVEKIKVQLYYTAALRKNAVGFLHAILR